jgi:hypothetical protein
MQWAPAACGLAAQDAMNCLVLVLSATSSLAAIALLHHAAKFRPRRRHVTLEITTGDLRSIDEIGLAPTPSSTTCGSDDEVTRTRVRAIRAFTALRHPNARRPVAPLA